MLSPPLPPPRFRWMGRISQSQKLTTVLYVLQVSSIQSRLRTDRSRAATIRASIHVAARSLAGRGGEALLYHGDAFLHAFCSSFVIIRIYYKRLAHSHNYSTASD